MSRGNFVRRIPGPRLGLGVEEYNLRKYEEEKHRQFNKTTEVRIIKTWKGSRLPSPPIPSPIPEQKKKEEEVSTNKDNLSSKILEDRSFYHVTKLGVIGKEPPSDDIPTSCSLSPEAKTNPEQSLYDILLDWHFPLYFKDI